MAASEHLEFSAQVLAAALEFHRNAGVETTLGAISRDRYAESLTPSPAIAPLPAPMPAAPKISPPASPPPLVRKSPPAAHLAAEVSDVVASAAQMAREAMDFDALREILENFDGCALKATASRLVFEDGTRGARVMIVGEAPGADEDREGRPFVGRAGRLLDKMLASIGLDRSLVYIANIAPWRPPGNRTPTPQEAAICLPFIRRQIELCAPDYLICLGAPAMQALLDVREGVLKNRGVWRSYQCADRNIFAMAMLHPAYLLRQSAQKKWAWRDLRKLRRALDGQAPAIGDA